MADWEWRVVEPLLPPERPARGRPGRSHRAMLDAMFWLARSGATRREVPERYGSWKSVATRFAPGAGDGGGAWRSPRW